MSPLLIGEYVPAGSYKDSSRNIKVTLTAECEDEGGEWLSSELDLTPLSDAEIANIDGQLTVVGRARTYLDRPFVPNGSYKLTSRAIQVTLSAECERINGLWRTSTLDLTDYAQLPGQSIANIDGTLTFVDG